MNGGLRVIAWSPYGSSCWPHKNVLYSVMCGSGNLILLRIVVLNSKGDSLKKCIIIMGEVADWLVVD